MVCLWALATRGVYHYSIFDILFNHGIRVDVKCWYSTFSNICKRCNCTAIHQFYQGWVTGKTSQSVTHRLMLWHPQQKNAEKYQQNWWWNLKHKSGNNTNNIDSEIWSKKSKDLPTCEKYQQNWFWKGWAENSVGASHTIVQSKRDIILSQVKIGHKPFHFCYW